MSPISTILSFMQREDRNGSWLEWLDDIESNESIFDAKYVISTLQEWFNDYNDQKYVTMINLARSIQNQK